MEHPGTSVGMAEIAKAAGVAVSTVSRALSGASGVSQTKRDEILEIARSLGYLASDTVSNQTDSAKRPQRQGRPTGADLGEPGRRLGNRSQRPRITAVVPESDRWIFGAILAGIQDVLTPAEVSLQVRQGLSASERQQLLADPHLAEETDLLILVPAPREMTVTELHDLYLPAVVAGTVVEGIPSVGIDDVAVGMKATNYLRNLGLTATAYVGILDHDGTPGVATHRRGVGYEKSMTRAGLSPRHVMVPAAPNPGRVAAEILLASENPPQGVICSSDEIAADMMAAFRQAGVGVPDDISVMGVDDHPIAAALGLSTIAQPAREQGRAAARLALRLLKSDPIAVSTESITLDTRLIIRDTTKRQT